MYATFSVIQGCLAVPAKAPFGPKECIMSTCQTRKTPWRPGGPHFGLLAAVVLAILAAAIPSIAWGEVWRFGIVADTQWNVPNDGQSPNSIPAGIIQQIHREFIRQNVRFVIAVGDLVDKANQDSVDARALYVQDLYNAGIGFYPLRGNHDAAWGGPNGSGPEFQRIYPQGQNGRNNATPAFSAGLGVDTGIAPQPKTRSDTFVVGGNFSSPDVVCNGVSKAGLTYSFDYHDARCILLDQWEDSSSKSASTIEKQLDWIDARLADPNRPAHAFVFGHKNLLGARNKNNLFGNNIGKDDPGDGNGVPFAQLSEEQQTAMQAKQDTANKFIASLQKRGVHVYISGHDHLHYNSIVASPNGKSRVRQLIGQSASSKFHIPVPPVSSNETAISQDVDNVGFYVVEVAGPQTTFHYYAAPVVLKHVKVDDHLLAKTPDFTGKWQELERFGYSLNGREFLVPQGQSYTVVQDDTAQAVAHGETGYLGTTAAILAGVNGNAARTSHDRPLTRAVNTGWAPAAGTASDVFTLWGLHNCGDTRPDTYVLAMTFRGDGVSDEQLAAGQLVLAAKDKAGRWVNAVEAIPNVTKKFVFGPYDARYQLGDYGVDQATHTAWAVLNTEGEFAVVAPASVPAE